jgi:hypothetical protein
VDNETRGESIRNQCVGRLPTREAQSRNTVDFTQNIKILYTKYEWSYNYFFTLDFTPNIKKNKESVNDLIKISLQIKQIKIIRDRKPELIFRFFSKKYAN